MAAFEEATVVRYDDTTDQGRSLKVSLASVDYPCSPDGLPTPAVGVGNPGPRS